MKSEIEKGILILIPETKKDVKKLSKFIKNNASEGIIPKSRKQFAYYVFDKLHIAISS